MITYDPVASLFSLWFPTTDYGSTAGTPITLSWNQQTAQFFPNYYSTATASSVSLVVPSTTSYTTIGSLTYIQAIQECPNITSWDSLGSIQMTTDLGIVPEDRASSTVPVASSTANVSPQLTDILVDSGSGQLLGGSRSGIVEYLPSGIPRWINLRTSSFTSFNVFLNWASKSGSVFPLVLPAGTQATMKLMFRHRSARTDAY